MTNQQPCNYTVPVAIYDHGTRGTAAIKQV